MSERMRPWPASRVPGLQEFKKNPREFTDSHVETLKLLVEITTAKNERRDLINATPALPDLQAKFKDSYDSYVQRTVEQKVVKFIERNRLSNDPFLRYGKTPEFWKINEVPPWDFFKKAFTLLHKVASNVGITDQERAKQLAAIDKKITKLKEDLASASPEKYFILREGAVRADAREVFFEHWRNMQAWCRDDIDYQGFALSSANADVQYAHRRAEVGKAILSKATNFPARGPRRDHPFDEHGVTPKSKDAESKPFRGQVDFSEATIPKKRGRPPKKNVDRSGYVVRM